MRENIYDRLPASLAEFVGRQRMSRTRGAHLARYATTETSLRWRITRPKIWQPTRENPGVNASIGIPWSMQNTVRIAGAHCCIVAGRLQKCYEFLTTKRKINELDVVYYVHWIRPYPAVAYSVYGGMVRP